MNEYFDSLFIVLNVSQDGPWNDVVYGSRKNYFVHIVY